MAATEGRERGLVRLAILQQLRAAYGIKLKNRTAKGKPSALAHSKAGAGKVFGVGLHELPHQIVPEYGSIPCFLVEACKYLEEHIHTEGLFRKSGSFIRLKTLKSKLDLGENCLPTAQPCDVAGLLKQFFRELPEPILPCDLQEALMKAQQLGSEERNSATLLLSCLLSDGTMGALRFFFMFLKKVSLRSDDNKMDSSNLAVILAPNLLQSSNTDKMSAQTEKKLRLQAAVLQILIDHAEDIGRVPKFILQNIPTMLGVDDPVSTPSLKDYEESESDTPSDGTRRRRQSMGVFSSVTPVTVTPGFKRKYPADSCQSFSAKKRRSIRHTLALELLPNSLFNNINSTPGSAQLEASPFMCPEVPQSSLSTSVMNESHLHSIGSRRSKRIANKKVHRVESGKMGCFSPKISRKEMVRRSLRLKFILGRSSRESTGVEHSASKRSENIGRRLANQQDVEGEVDSEKIPALLSPCVGELITQKDSKNISKSEENLQIPHQCNEASYCMPWLSPSASRSQETKDNISTACLKAETCSSEPALEASKEADIPIKSRPTVASTKQDSNDQQVSFCEDENNLTADTLLKIKKAFSESGSNLHNLFEVEPSELKSTQGATCVSELIVESNLCKGRAQKITTIKKESSLANKSSAADKHLSTRDCIKVLDASLSQNAAESNYSIHEFSESDASVKDEKTVSVTSLSVHSNRRSSSQKEILESGEKTAKNKGYKISNSEKENFETREVSHLPEDGETKGKSPFPTETHENSKVSPSGKVADHILWFNKLSLNESCSAAKTKPPLKFQRTPVRQSIRRINSILETNKQPSKATRGSDDCPSLVKSVSYETALSFSMGRFSSTSTTSLPCSELACSQLSMCDQFCLTSKSCPQLTCSLEEASRPGTSCKETLTTSHHSKCVLEDLTNHEVAKTGVKMSTSSSVSPTSPDKYVFRKSVVGKRARYKGSPRNPIGAAKLLPAVKPLDL
uniref:Rho-GAP domain-containing protein n=1 Tax=Salvator merianae TaxID=96440 RepID=A0A8D0DPD1_SALMN